MLIVAVAWIYVVLLMAMTEPTVVSGIAVLLFYCVLPLSLVIYMAGTGKRRAKRRAAEWAAHLARQAAADEANEANEAGETNETNETSKAKAKAED